MAYVSMKEFNKRATPWYSSSVDKIPAELKPLETALGGPYDPTMNEDNRVYTDPQLRSIQELIWPMGVTMPTDPVLVMKAKYKKAFGYVAHQLFHVAESDVLLATSQKTKWQKRTLRHNKLFVHATKRKVGELRKGGLKSAFASEVCYNSEGMGLGTLIGQGATGLSWSTHKFVFLAPAKMKGGQVDDSYSGGAVKGQGFGKERYYVQVPSGTDYMCEYDLDAPSCNYNGEVAFMRDFDRTDIYVMGSGGLTAI